MNDSLRYIAAALSAARQKAALTQGALGAKVGFAQSHVSKIERAAVDLQTSNLIELARALDLEMMLVPRQFVPAVQALVGELARESRHDSDEQTSVEVPAYSFDVR